MGSCVWLAATAFPVYGEEDISSEATQILEIGLS